MCLEYNSLFSSFSSHPFPKTCANITVAPNVLHCSFSCCLRCVGDTNANERVEEDTKQASFREEITRKTKGEEEIREKLVQAVERERDVNFESEGQGRSVVSTLVQVGYCAPSDQMSSLV